MFSKSEIMSVIKMFSPVDQASTDFLAFYRQVIESVDETADSLVVQSGLTMNFKLALALVQDQKKAVPWIQNDLGTGDSFAMAKQTRRFLYSTEFNSVRDHLRYTLESWFVKDRDDPTQRSLWAHFEVFADREMLPRLEESESSEKAKMRHLQAGTLPHRDLFSRVANSNTMEEFLLQLYLFDPVRDAKILLELEALMSSFDQKDLDKIKPAWMKQAGFAFIFPFRAEKIYAIRRLRDLKAEISAIGDESFMSLLQLNPGDIIDILGHITGEDTLGFDQVISVNGGNPRLVDGTIAETFTPWWKTRDIVIDDHSVRTFPAGEFIKF